jgi:hypothetical protein
MKAVTAATAFGIFRTIVMALGWARLLAASTGTTNIEGKATEGELHGRQS